MIYQVSFFTLIQASLSTILSIGIGLMIARMLFVHPKLWIETILSLPLIIPSLSLVVGITTMMGETIHLFYGLKGIVMCHLYLNIPLATLIFLDAYRSIPPSVWYLTTLLRLPKSIRFIKIELPMMQFALGKTIGIIFLFCFSSFTIPLMIGGGPHGNTLIVALYHSLVIKGDFNESCMWLGIKGLLGLIIIILLSRYQNVDIKASVKKHKKTNTTLFYNLWYNIIITSILLLLISPLLALLTKLKWSDIQWSSSYTQAIYGSLTVAGITSFITNLIALIICCFKPLPRIWIERLSSLIMTIPSFAMGIGILWIHVRYLSLPISPLSVLLIISILTSWPIALRILHSAFLKIEANNKHLMDNLYLPITARLRWIYLPLLKPTLRLSFALIAVYSLGDLGSILCFSSHEIQTLPKLIYEAYDHFNLMTAQFLSLVLTGLAVSIFIFCTSRNHHA